MSGLSVVGIRVVVQYWLVALESCNRIGIVHQSCIVVIIWSHCGVSHGVSSRETLLRVIDVQGRGPEEFFYYQYILPNFVIKSDITPYIPTKLCTKYM